MQPSDREGRHLSTGGEVAVVAAVGSGGSEVVDGREHGPGGGLGGAGGEGVVVP